MSRHASIGRDSDGLRAALEGITRPSWTAGSPPGSASRTGQSGGTAVETENLALVARAVLTASLLRTESRGCHVRTDFPLTDAELARSTGLVLRDGRFETRDLATCRTDWNEDGTLALSEALTLTAAAI